MSTVTSEVSSSLRRMRRARAVRRAFIAVLCAILLAGVAGLLGVRSGTARAAGGGYELELSYPRVARAGLAAPWSLTIRRPGGFDATVTLATTADYLDLFEENALDPEPESSTNDGARTLWEFKAPDQGETMVVALDSRIGPNVHLEWARRGVTAVLEDGMPVVEVHYRTTVVP